MRGFTLIELLIIIGIIGVLVLGGIPAFRTYQSRLELSGVVRSLVSDLRYSQQLAVTEQVEHSVYFVPDQKKYELRRYGEATTTLKTVLLPEEILEISVTGLTVAGAYKEARYNPYGAVKDSGVIVLRNTQNTTTTIEVQPSGFIKISD